MGCILFGTIWYPIQSKIISSFCGIVVYIQNIILLASTTKHYSGVHHATGVSPVVQPSTGGASCPRAFSGAEDTAHAFCF